ncbi:hypothetical protein CK203_086927 [Vitis vinifera]|uniref:Uncharacterized protein n=1 Tax=Vitis vinifera TaxID=29760 RepID=A0A438EAF7_VITVI|nr:hypothetical protein CK203_086927 [Vitis vinifera]
MDSQKKLGIEKESTLVEQGEILATRRALDLSLTHSARYWLCSECWKGLFFKKTENRDTEVYSDADWAGNIIDRPVHFWILFFCLGKSCYLEKVLSELGQTSSSPILMMCDNQAAISIAKNPCIMTGPSTLRLTDTSSQRR